LSFLLTPFDLKRLESYANNMLDYHVVLDLLPTTASLYFQKRLGGDVRLSAVQSAILLALGLQRKTVEEVEVSSQDSLEDITPTLSQTELQLPVSQILALFVKVVRKIAKRLVDVQKAAISAELPDPSATAESRVGVDAATPNTWKPVETTLEDELNEAGDEATAALREKQRAMIDSLDLTK
jgi:N-acetyltransferase 10